MANESSAEKTEQPTAKKRRDAKKKGDVAKSKDLTSTLTLLAWLAICGVFITIASQSLLSLIDVALDFHTENLDYNIKNMAQLAFDSLVLLSTIVLLPMALTAVFSEFMQAGAIFTLEKVRFNLTNLDPVAGVKRIFSMDSAFDTGKNLVKTICICLIGWLIFLLYIKDVMRLADSSVYALAALLKHIFFILCAFIVLAFLFICVIDILYQRYSKTKKLRMSKHEVRQEHKDNEGDPQIKGQRKRMHRQWAQQSATENTRTSSVLVVNPTHVAIALAYHREEIPVPVINAMGEDDIALSMRQVAKEEGIPVLRNIELARELLEHGEEGQIIPADYFDIIAEVVLWAQTVRQKMEGEGGTVDANNSLAECENNAPGEDLTVYH